MTVFDSKARRFSSRVDVYYEDIYISLEESHPGSYDAKLLPHARSLQIQH